MGPKLNENVNRFLKVVNYERIGPPTDMWGVGVICYILLSGKTEIMVVYFVNERSIMLTIVMIRVKAFPRSWERRMERRLAISTGDNKNSNTSR